MTDQEPETVTTRVADLVVARSLIEALEEIGVPSNAIELVDVQEPPVGEVPGEAEVTPTVGAVGRASATAVAIGAVVGTVIGLVIDGVLRIGQPIVAGGLGAVFGGALGAAMGGMAVARYNSAAHALTYDAADAQSAVVIVSHADPTVAAAARRVMQTRGHTPE